MNFKHQSILLAEVLENLQVKQDGIYVDGTLGGGGHSLAIAAHLGTGGRLIGIDRDEDAICAATERLRPYEEIVTIVKSNYGHMEKVMEQLGITGVDGILLDLGVSSYQLDSAERGFSYREDAPLDMRMDKSGTMTAKDIVNGYSEMELFRVIARYGEDKFAKNIAKHIVKSRQEKEIETTLQLSEIIKGAIPMKIRKMGGHPAKKTFQAIRIELNRELEILEDTLQNMIRLLKHNGRICIITFHSLEDRIVKNIFRENENPCICPPDFPVCVCNRKPTGKVITKKPILPSEDEIHQNSRAKSAKMRVFHKIIPSSTKQGHEASEIMIH